MLLAYLVPSLFSESLSKELCSSNSEELVWEVWLRDLTEPEWADGDSSSILKMVLKFSFF